MTTTWYLTIKPTFLNELMALPVKEIAQVNKKLQLLAQDPTPDAKTKKRLKGVTALHRLRSGDYRIFYTYQEPYVSVLSVRMRDEATYDGMPEAELLGGAPETDAFAPGNEAGPAGAEPEQWKRWLAPPAAKSTPLGRPISEELLNGLGIDARFHAVLTKIDSEEALLDCTTVPPSVIDRLIDAVTGRPLEQIAQQPDLRLDTADDLLRYREGGLLGFLLRLSPEQERLVHWANSAKGPTLLKGGPGTGKSTVALYRLRVLVDALRKDGVDQPRILFTTYTNALVRFSEQLIQSLLGDDSPLVEVRTADSVAMSVARRAGLSPAVVDSAETRKVMQRAVEQARFEGSSLTQAAQRRTLEKLDAEYLEEEILGVIEGRALETLEAYQAAARPGRQLSLNKTQREAVWRVREAFVAELERAGKATWEGVRAAAARALASGAVDEKYDAVVIDEAQDLSPGALQVLVRLAAQPNRLFLTADANQSIYGAGFRWSDVHGWLQFQGRTGILKANHRSTREIGEAAYGYLGVGALDEDEQERRYVHAGPLPAVRAVATHRDEAKLLARFFRGASRELRLGIGSCAVLCPTNAAAQRIAAELAEHGMEARYMAPKELDLDAPVAKTITLKSAKGLEFPIVALAGFADGSFPHIPSDATEEARAEITHRERRTMFVAMTRAMRALLVVKPTDASSELLDGFEREAWNLGEASA